MLVTCPGLNINKGREGVGEVASFCVVTVKLLNTMLGKNTCRVPYQQFVSFVFVPDMETCGFQFVKLSHKLCVKFGARLQRIIHTQDRRNVLSFFFSKNPYVLREHDLDDERK